MMVDTRARTRAMTTYRHFGHLSLIAAFLLCGITASPADQRQQHPQRIETAPSIELLQRARLIRCSIRDPRTGQQREIAVTDPARLASVRAWIQQYAWPPIDVRTIGSVISRGHLAIFERATDDKPAITIGVYGATSRAEPHRTHVTSEAWQKLLSLIPPE